MSGLDGGGHLDRPERDPARADEIGATERADGPLEKPTNHLGYKDEPAREFRAEHADEYLEPMKNYPTPIEPFSDPKELAEAVNPDRDLGDPYQKNCADCARCFERSWRGQSEEAAGRAYQMSPEHGGLVLEGENSSRTESWAGEKFSDTYDPGEVRRRIEAAGHGTSAIVHTAWEREDGQRFGHAYNVVNYRDEILVVDPQHGEILPWNEGTIHPWVSGRYEHRALAWDARGQRIW